MYGSKNQKSLGRSGLSSKTDEGNQTTYADGISQNEIRSTDTYTQNIQFPVFHSFFFLVITMAANVTCSLNLKTDLFEPKVLDI